MLTFTRMRSSPRSPSSTPRSSTTSRPATAAGCILLYDERGTLKCETCFQCAAACPIECIDMGGVDTKSRYHVHWGPRRAVRRAARGVGAAPLRPAGARPRLRRPSPPIDLAPLDAILARGGLRPARAADHPRADPGRLRPPAGGGAPAHRHQTGAWYSELYGIATSYPHLRFEPPSRPRRRRLPLPDLPVPAAAAASLAAFEAALSARRRRGQPGRRGAPRGGRLPRRPAATAPS